MDDDIFGLNAMNNNAVNAQNSIADPLGALGADGAAGTDGWGGDEDLINFDGAQGAGRVRIEARSLAGRSPQKSPSKPGDGPRAPVSRDPATLGVPLSRDILGGFRLALKQHGAFERTWMSEGSGCRRPASFWNAKIETSSFARNRDRVSLGSYAVPAYHDPTKAVGQPANALEIADNKAWSMTGSTHMAGVVDALFPHPVRFRQVWGQEWKHTAAYAWAAVPPPGFSALGMVLTSSSAPPPLTAMRCVPTRWTCPSSQPRLVWDNGGGGGRPASIWIVNSPAPRTSPSVSTRRRTRTGYWSWFPPRRCSPRMSWIPARERRADDKAVSSSGADNKEGLRGRAACSNPSLGSSESARPRRRGARRRRSTREARAATTFSRARLIF